VVSTQSTTRYGDVFFFFFFFFGALRSFLTTSPFLYISSENWRCEMVSFEQLS
jgi:hypothetical protein